MSTYVRNVYVGDSFANKMYVGSDLVFKRFAVGGDFSIDTDELDYYGMSGTSTINVSGTYYSWTASTSDSWITLTDPTGSGDGSFSITVANNTEGMRIGTVTVVGRTISGVVKQHTVNVRQSILQVPLVNSQIWYMTKNNQPVTLNSGFSPSGVSLNNNSYVNQLGVCVISLSGNLTQCNNPFNPQATGADNAVIAIAIPNSFTGDKIAPNVKDLETVFIGSGCTYLNDGALQGNNSMKEIYCYATTAPTLHNYALYYVTNGGPAQNGVLHIPQGCTASYSSWMENDKKRLGYYNWTCVDDLPNPNL